MGAAWRHVLMRLGKCVVSLPPLGWLQKKSERGSRVMFFLGRHSLYFDSFICWVTHSLLVSLSLSLSAAGPDGALRKPGAQIDPSMRTCMQTHTFMRKHNFWQRLRKKTQIQGSRACERTSLLNPTSLRCIPHLLSLQEAWGECGPSLISPQPVPPLLFV